MKKIAIILFVLISFTGIGQNTIKQKVKEEVKVVNGKSTTNIVEEVPFVLIEEAPIFPGCKANKDELRKCFNYNLQMHVLKKFNVELAQELNLSPGKKRIAVQFIIDQEGNIINIESRAPHPKLKEEIERVVKTLPQMIPAKQKGEPVKMRFNMPITFVVEDNPKETKAERKQRKKMERRNKKYGY